MDVKYKTFDTEIKADNADANRCMTFTISTGAVDRDGDIIDPKGWDLGHYMKNPTVLFAHDYSSLPVAKAVSIHKTDSGLTATAEFPPVGVYPFADTVFEMLKSGFLNATSVGFQSTEYEPMKNGKGFHHKSQQLLEWSIVPVPCNPEALAQRGIKNEQLKQYAKEMNAWAKGIIGESSPKMTQEQFDSLSGELAKILRETPEEKVAPVVTVQAPSLDIHEVAIAVAKILEEKKQVVSTDVLDLSDEDSIIDLDALQKENSGIEIDAAALSNVLVEEMRKTLKEMAGAQARAAINKLTGRLD